MISQTEGRQRRGAGRQPIIWLNFAKNFMKMKKIGPRGERVQNFTI